jgi:hypothetical protein
MALRDGFAGRDANPGSFRMREVRLRAAVEALQFAPLIDHLRLDPSDDDRNDRVCSIGEPPTTVSSDPRRQRVPRSQ